MSNFFIGLFTTLFILFFSLGVAVIVRFLYLYFKYKKSPGPTNANQDSKIYYIRSSFPPKKRRVKRKSPSIALKSIIIKPKEFSPLDKD